SRRRAAEAAPTAAEATAEASASAARGSAKALYDQRIRQPLVLADLLQLLLQVRAARGRRDNQVRRLPGDPAAEAAPAVPVRGRDLFRRRATHVECLELAVLHQRHRRRRYAVVVHRI